MKTVAIIQQKKIIMKAKYIWLLSLALTFIACSSDDDSLADPYVQDNESTVTPSNGGLDFTNFVAIGNSLTAGYSDNALFAKGQYASFPNILANQFQLVGGGEFTQPLMNDDVGGLLLAGNPIPGFGPRLIFDAVNQVPTPFPGMPTTDLMMPIPGPYNNMGVPGVKVTHVLAPNFGDLNGVLAGTANPYFVRMASSPTASIMDDALAMNPTFYSLWLGNNDVLGYATSGGDGTNPITDLATFTAAYNIIAEQLASVANQGIIANIPSVTSAPHFTTVPHNPLDPTNPSFGPLIPTLNGVFGQLNLIYQALGMPEREIVFATDAASAVVIEDETLVDISATIEGALNTSPTFPAFVQSFGLPAAAAPIVANLLGNFYGQSRQATADELLVLPSSSVIGTVNQTTFAYLQGLGLPPALAGQFAVEGVTLPLADKWVLLPSEQEEIAVATEAFNQVIADAATANGVPLFNANAFLEQVATTGVTSGSVNVTDDFVTGGAFSLDGIHPSPRGYAVAANEMIKLINSFYGANIPTVNPANFTGVYLD